ncbi:hypothetical protein JCM24511_09800 [Saitozyma sp. JCM 24511]|nr:hypothetical protein JCM24511_09800 [Saitozyma sp. JCM 24511]
MPNSSFEDVDLRDACSSIPPAESQSQSDAQTPDSQEFPSGSQSSSQHQHIKVKRLKPKASEEGDILIDYIDGMMDAIERRYLASMKLIVFLDQARPDNFHYPDADSPPTLSMDQAVQRLSVSAATKKTSRSLELGVAQTESQVIRSIKNMLKAAIEATQSLPDLPHTRYINMKLYYTDETPDGYEPPHFRGDSQGLVMGTHAVSEAPLQFMAGSMQTGHHGVTMRLSSVVEHLEVPQGDPLPYNVERLMDHHEAQLEDAASRTILWDAEDPPADTSPNVSNILPEADQAPSTSIRLLGRRLQNGSILPLPGALGLDSFQAAAVGEESIRGRFSDRVERPQDIYQRQRRKPSLSPAPASIATGKTPKARKRRSATPKKSSRSSKSTNAQATSQAAKKQKAKKKSIKPAPKKSKVAVAVQSTAVEPIAMCCCGSADGNDEMVCCDGYPTSESLPQEFFCVACRKEQSLRRPLNKKERAEVDDQLNPLSLFRDVLLDRLGELCIAVRT